MKEMYIGKKYVFRNSSVYICMYVLYVGTAVYCYILYLYGKDAI